MSVTSAYAAWLQTEALYSQAIVAGASAAWGVNAIDSSIISPLVNKADADAEATRQAAFLHGPIARDTAVVKGQRRDLIGKAITLAGNALGYDAGVVVFVVGADETQVVGCTKLSILRRL